MGKEKTAGRLFSTKRRREGHILKRQSKEIKRRLKGDRQTVYREKTERKGLFEFKRKDRSK